MAKVLLRDARRSDLAAFVPNVPFRLMALTGEDEAGNILGVGGVAFLPDGRKMAFTELTPEARRHPVTLHRAALRALDMARAAGVRELVATTDAKVTPAGERWLVRLGFEQTDIGGVAVWVWKNNDLS